MVAERALDPDVVLRDVPFEDDLRVRGHLQIHRLAADELDRLAAKEPGEHELVEMLRERSAGGVRGHRIEPDRYGNRNAAILGREEIGATVLVHLPVHEGRGAVDHLHPVHADVARRRCCGSFVMTAGSVMNGAGSPGQQRWTGNRPRSTSAPSKKTS